ncbi:protein obstructor-E isoform X2 [Orussus abietinus]|uniref:protein obstructor-E isoform X2 n=1 Tax=Orussus abietinus TaxID=222816 RepID=UPI0006267DBC|nr:protein obstructor-E isoform X2 [Orussus abietinus]XP_012288767.1 protein obstructor-E isoform X2 [Orussus abietinus]XP_012288768.1 protein obstructor-E isoform X2 [Orussus abietinus]XP_012288770.1 protein obstructor-E isoform X2 [Orussus abietinus]XP_023288174.1 protein obstructor-E isoform X2 [Orussus abietinus]
MARRPIFSLLFAPVLLAVCTAQFFKTPQFSASLNQVGQGPTQRGSSASCPEKNGRFPVPSQCDAYIECIDGVPEQKVCPEGLMFNPEARFNYPCGYPIDINCEGRPNLQPAQPTDNCPHQYGYFKMGDRQNCGQFINCADGVGYVFDCPEGLAYNAETYRCDWPDQVADCDAEAFLGFSCPPEDNQGFFLPGQLRFYRSQADCQRYYVCIEGRPRLQNCGEGNAFNELTGSCDGAENVTGCATGLERSNTKPTRLF